LQANNQWTLQPQGTSIIFAFDSFGVFRGNYLFAGVNVGQPGGGPTIDSSDARIKTVDGSYTAGLAQIEQLRPIRYRFRGNDTMQEGDPPTLSPHYQAAHDRREFIGLVAQEVERVIPEMVKRVPGFIDNKPVNDMRNLDTTPLIFALVNAVKELAARNADLVARVATLEAKR
jgi:hypothetical protein